MRQLDKSGAVWAIASAILVGVVFVAIACGGDFTPTGPNTGKARNCSVAYNSYWPTNGTVHIDAPTECPFHISGFTHINYASTATVNAGSVVPDQFVITVADWKINTVAGTTVNTTWNTDGNPWTIAISGDYYAGQAGFDANNTGYDTMYDQFYTSPGPNPQAIATVTMAYSYGFANVGVVAPDAVGPGVPFTAHASISDVNYLPPVSYAWAIDGNSVPGDADVSLTGPSNGTSMQITVTTTDVNGVQHTNSHMVAACPDNQITC